MSLNKVIVITGASCGIGEGIARFLSEDARDRKSKVGLVLVARRETVLNEVASEIEHEYCTVLTVPTDITKLTNVQQILELAKAKFEKVTCWINNVGLGISRSVLHLTDEDIDTMILVNLKSAVYGMQTIVPYFREQAQGHFIIISSVLARVPYGAHRSMYSASKAALNVLTSNLRLELQADPACQNIHVTTVIPGLVATEFVARSIGDPAPISFAHYKAPFTGPFPPTAQTVDDVSKVVCEVVNSKIPPREVYTNPVHAPLVVQYYENVGEFELRLRPPST